MYMMSLLLSLALVVLLSAAAVSGGPAVSVPVNLKSPAEEKNMEDAYASRQTFSVWNIDLCDFDSSTPVNFLTCTTGTKCRDHSECRGSERCCIITKCPSELGVGVCKPRALSAVNAAKIEAKLKPHKETKDNLVEDAYASHTSFGTIDFCDFDASAPINSLSCNTGIRCRDHSDCRESGRCCIAANCELGVGVCKPLSTVDKAKIETKFKPHKVIKYERDNPMGKEAKINKEMKKKEEMRNEKENLMGSVQGRCPKFPPQCGRATVCNSDTDCSPPRSVCCPAFCGANICAWVPALAGELVREMTIKGSAEATKKMPYTAYVQRNLPDKCGPEYDVPSCKSVGFSCANSGHCYNARCCEADCGQGRCTPYPIARKG